MADGFAKVFTAMLEPVKSCNLSCRYCYSDTENGGVMSHEVLSPALEKIIHYTEQTGFSEIHFVWHGGEPLLAGIDFFRYAVTVLNKLASKKSIWSCLSKFEENIQPIYPPSAWSNVPAR